MGAAAAGSPPAPSPSESAWDVVGVMQMYLSSRGGGIVAGTPKEAIAPRRVHKRKRAEAPCHLNQEKPMHTQA